MKKYLLLLISISLFFTSCQTAKLNSIATNQQKVSDIQKIYLLNSINSIDNNVFNKMDIEDIIGSDINKLRLVENEVPYLKKNLESFDINLHKALRLASIEYQDILLKYANKLEIPTIYPNNLNYNIGDENEITLLLKTFNDEINFELDEVYKQLFSDTFAEYKELATNYNIYCDSLRALNRMSLSQIDTDISNKIKSMFKQIVNKTINNIEESYRFEKTSINPDYISITN